MGEDLDRTDEAFATTLAHTTMLTALFGVLQEKGLFSQADVNEVIDRALVGAENSVRLGADARLMSRTRQILEQTSRNLGGPRRRR